MASINVSKHTTLYAIGQTVNKLYLIVSGTPSLGFSTRFFQNYILIDVIQVSINAGFFCCLKI